MKTLYGIIIGMLLVAVVYAKITVLDGVEFINLPTNGDSPYLVISGTQVYQNELIGEYGYTSGTPTTTTSNGAWHPISGAFTNEVNGHFTASGDSVLYQGNERKLLFLLTRYGTTTVKDINIAIGVKHNTNILTGSIAGAFISAVGTEYQSLTSISQATLSSGDTIQLVIKSDKNANLTPTNCMASATPFY